MSTRSSNTTIVELFLSHFPTIHKKTMKSDMREEVIACTNNSSLLNHLLEGRWQQPLGQ
jgi:hypothetical protein